MLNKIVVMGRLVKDPDLRATASGKPVANFTLAVERDREVNGERATDFIDCVAWNGTAEFVSKYFSKGSMAVVAGRFQSRKYTDKDGNNRTAWEIVAENVYAILYGTSKPFVSPVKRPVWLNIEWRFE